MMYPLVQELAVDGIAVTLTCRVLGFSKQAFYKWQANPVTDREWADAHLINTALDIHADDPAFGYRFIADQLAERGITASENRVQRLCQQEQIWSVFAKKRGLSRRAGPPVHDDLVDRDFTAPTANRVWLTDITEHPTAEGKLYLCAIKDVWSTRIVGYSMSSRMTAALAVSALSNAVALRDPAGTTVHSDRGSQGELNRSSQHLTMMEVCSGAKAAVGGQGASAGDEVTGAADSGASCGARVLASDRSGQEHRGCHCHDRGVGPRRVALVPSRWRHATREPRRTDRPILVVR